ncbi:putative MFS family arabinose efflux permease [Actinomadura pelletieri DSM 43383]|uniref:Putative MFS family arabinose efflux permease n=1 Tax=Actinomadura pelletieri DSM 43383 TaxID=1120940 RepID=A0A495QLS8_9ACTN|nr:MFS transporter [Actinomadura pelletieri]RKS73534.1 putative MFS family arabinose efflux permease [Actinomadura pelletieri DSM 43383]
MYAYAFLEDFILLYPVYALLFADTGLSPAAISSLFVIWSVTTFMLEVPSGVWADVFSRRLLLVASPLLAGVGFGLWSFFPSYAVFAVGFVLWGAGSALRSGTMQALVYEELERVGAAGSYARLIGRSEAMSLVGVVVASALASPVLAAGGYRALGVASVVVCGLCAVAGWLLPESRGGGGGGEEPSLGSVVRAGWAQVRGGPSVRWALVLVMVVEGVTSLDEYVPLLARSTGVAVAVVPLLVLVVTVGDAVGGWVAGRGVRWLAPVLGVGGVLLAVGALSGSAGGMVLVGAAFGVFRWAMAAADARLQERIGDGARATVTSVAGFGAEVVALLVYVGYALGSRWAGAGVLVGVAAVPYVVVAVVLGVVGRRGRVHRGM